MTFKNKIKNRKVLIFGLGLQGGGLGDTLWLYQNGAHLKVTDLQDEQSLASSLHDLPEDIELSLGGHLREDIDWADIIIKNPGVPDDNEFMLYAKKQGKNPITSVAIIVQEARSKVIGVTGTRGKSTTTELIYRVLHESFKGKVIRGGNIPGSSGLAMLDQINEAKFLVLELSSFQLHNFHDLKISPHIAVVTNVYPDHLNRYTSLREYVYDKQAITSYQNSTDIVIFNNTNEGARDIAQLSPGKKHPFQISDLPLDWSIQLPGDHNKENVAAAIALSKVLDIKQDRVKNIIEDFHGLPFRLELRTIKKGVSYVNDTTSTTPTSTIKAVNSTQTPMILILGGPSKKLPIDDMLFLVATSAKVKKLVILGGDDNLELQNKLDSTCQEKILGRVHSMKEAVALASKNAQPGWTVLLSPGFFSFDLFQNEFDRGRQFNLEVDKLRN